MSKSEFFSPLEPPDSSRDGGRQIWAGLQGSAGALAISRVAGRRQCLTVVLVPNSKESEILKEALEFYCPDSLGVSIDIFPEWENLPYDNFSPHKDIISERIRLLNQLQYQADGVLIVAADNAMQKLPPTTYVAVNSLSLDVGQSLDLDIFRRTLLENSYVIVDEVQSPGDFVIRGGVIDLFAIGAEDPIRIELFGNEIETLRYFSISDQRSVRKIEKIRILPGNEVPTDPKSIQRFRQGIRENLDCDPRDNEVYSQIDSESLPNGAEFYMPLFFESTCSLFDYIPAGATFFVIEDFDTAADRFWDYVQERYDLASQTQARLPLPAKMLYLSPKKLFEQIELRHPIHIDNALDVATHRFHSRAPEQDQRFKKIDAALDHVLKQSKTKTLFTMNDFGQREIVESALNRLDLEYSRVRDFGDFLQFSGDIAISMSDLQIGLHLPQEQLRVIASAEMFGYRGHIRKKSKRTGNPESIIASMQELNIGEPVVHEQYGIGLYDGLVTMNLTGQPAEFVKIKYLGGESLYVSVHNVDYITRYIGGNSEEVTPHALGSNAWNRAKQKARKQAYDIAAELLAIQSLRDSRQGNAMPIPTEEYQEFVSRFRYTETPDQASAIESVLDDLGSSRPMDRLVCGDVGFGKTEVAMRAALIAVANGFQVAIVVPTRPLAQQHHDVFLDRFSELGIQIELLSQMRSRSDTLKVVERLETGKVDIAIGTHRLLQKDIQFSNLGLVIVDEEHRFGVRQKEFLKKIRADVDFLTLTATPIPRTLSMALNKLRDISIIATPPDNRLSVRTFVRNWQSEIVREACLRELRRGGQIFYVHNNVKTIRKVAEEIGRIVPEAKIEFAHGQMSKLRLDQVMKDFYMHKFDLLVCTTIIESGIDIATANTIIIDKAYRFGLAQLHQLRGRVGRSHHQAYAYLLVPSKENLRTDARRRLEAIEAFDHLGVGYIIATHDLEIRGAGALLGEEQSGAINDIGYSIYSDYLNEAVESMKRGSGGMVINDDPLEVKSDVEIELQVTALIPDIWVPSVNMRLMLYRKIASTPNEHELNQLKDEMRDRFGKVPDEVNTLFLVKALKLKSQMLGVSKLSLKERSGRVVFNERDNINIVGIRNLIHEYPGTVKRIDAESTLQFTHSLKSEEERIKRAFLILKTLATETEASAA